MPVFGGSSGGSVSDPLTIGVINITDHLSAGATPAGTGALRLTADEYVISDNGAGSDRSLIGFDSVNAYTHIDAGWYGVKFAEGEVNINGVVTGVSITGTADQVVGGDPHSQFTNGALALLSGEATALATTKDSGVVTLGTEYWDGADRVSETYQIKAFKVAATANTGILKITAPDGTVFNIAAGPKLFPAIDNSGSLGKVGLTWGDIFATLPSSDPGNNGMWVNAANHNAVTIGDGS